jgi:8-hydroxy-5-deazaflavin:NADPH oxidoreductase
MKIAILGAGNIGGTLGRKWSAIGHEVVFGVRDVNSSKSRAAMQSAWGNAQFTIMEEAVACGEVVLFAIPWKAVPEAAKALCPDLAGKIIIDATNNFGGPVINNIAVLKNQVPDAHIFRAFNALGWEVFDNPSLHHGTADLFYTGPDGSSRAIMESLISMVGLRPIWVGDNDRAVVVDHLGLLWVTLANQRGMGRRIALKLLD